MHNELAIPFASQKENIVKMRNAWSRDQANKVYIQHLIAEDSKFIWETLGHPESTELSTYAAPSGLLLTSELPSKLHS